MESSPPMSNEEVIQFKEVLEKVRLTGLKIEGLDLEGDAPHKRLLRELVAVNYEAFRCRENHAMASEKFSIEGIEVIGKHRKYLSDPNMPTKHRLSHAITALADIKSMIDRGYVANTFFLEGEERAIACSEILSEDFERVATLHRANTAQSHQEAQQIVKETTLRCSRVFDLTENPVKSDRSFIMMPPLSRAILTRGDETVTESEETASGVVACLMKTATLNSGIIDELVDPVGRREKLGNNEEEVMQKLQKLTDSMADSMEKFTKMAENLIPSITQAFQELIQKRPASGDATIEEISLLVGADGYGANFGTGNKSGPEFLEAALFAALSLFELIRFAWPIIQTGIEAAKIVTVLGLPWLTSLTTNRLTQGIKGIVGIASEALKNARPEVRGMISTITSLSSVAGTVINANMISALYHFGMGMIMTTLASPALAFFNLIATATKAGVPTIINILDAELKFVKGSKIDEKLNVLATLDAGNPEQFAQRINTMLSNYMMYTSGLGAPVTHWGAYFFVLSDTLIHIQQYVSAGIVRLYLGVEMFQNILNFPGSVFGALTLTYVARMGLELTNLLARFTADKDVLKTQEFADIEKTLEESKEAGFSGKTSKIWRIAEPALNEFYQGLPELIPPAAKSCFWYFGGAFKYLLMKNHEMIKKRFEKPTTTSGAAPIPVVPVVATAVPLNAGDEAIMEEYRANQELKDATNLLFTVHLREFLRKGDKTNKRRAMNISMMLVGGVAFSITSVMRTLSKFIIRGYLGLQLYSKYQYFDDRGKATPSQSQTINLNVIGNLTQLSLITGILLPNISLGYIFASFGLSQEKLLGLVTHTRTVVSTITRDQLPFYFKPVEVIQTFFSAIQTDDEVVVFLAQIIFVFSYFPAFVDSLTGAYGYVYKIWKHVERLSNTDVQGSANIAGPARNIFTDVDPAAMNLFNAPPSEGYVPSTLTDSELFKKVTARISQMLISTSNIKGDIAGANPNFWNNRVIVVSFADTQEGSVQTALDKFKTHKLEAACNFHFSEFTLLPADFVNLKTIQGAVHVAGVKQITFDLPKIAVRHLASSDTPWFVEGFQDSLGSIQWQARIENPATQITGFSHIKMIKMTKLDKIKLTGVRKDINDQLDPRLELLTVIKFFFFIYV